MTNITPFNGWLLDAGADIDLHRAGVLNHLLRCTSERRHVIAAYLSRERPAVVFPSPTDLGDFLMVSTHNAILRAAWRSVPVGLRGAFGRAGKQPYARRYYTYLHALLSSPARPEMRAVIRHLPRLNSTRLRIARSLPPEARTARLVNVVRHLATARDINRLVDLATSRGVDRAAMTAALRNITSEMQVADWARRWSTRLPLPPHPVPASPFYQPIEHAGDLHAMAREHRNCARGYVSTVMEDRSSFAVMSIDDEKAVVHLVRAGADWRLDDVYGPANRPPSKRLTESACSYLRAHGIESRADVPAARREWGCLRRLTRAHDYEDDWVAA